jgi:signal transduction histidine kinase/CheY-like chemotaxis protein
METLYGELRKPRDERLDRLLFEVRQYKKDGSVFDVEISTSWLFDERGEIVGLQGSTRDISARKRMEENRARLESQLLLAQKMEAIGTLAGGIAHDFNNILSAIMGYMELFRKAIHDRPDAQKDVEEVLKATNRAKELVQQILTFSSHADQVKKPIRMIPVIEEGIRFLRASLPSHIEIRSRLNVISDLIMADATQIHQLLMNLGTNAGHAMRETGGVLEIGLEEVYMDHEDVARFPLLAGGRHLKLTIRDTGHGIRNEDLEKIFDPYFTTKEKGEGTGLGLAVVHGIVRDHQGEIRVYSEIDWGTVFEIYLPLEERRTEEEREMGEEGALVGGNERILFIDDEAVLAHLGKELLEGLGYTVFAETEPLKAIAEFRKDIHAYDLVITDKTMPVMNGFDVAREIRGIRADVPIILCSGFQYREDLEKISTLSITHFISKPIRINELCKAIRDSLDKR